MLEQYLEIEQILPAYAMHARTALEMMVLGKHAAASLQCPEGSWGYARRYCCGLVVDTRSQCQELVDLTTRQFIR